MSVASRKMTSYAKTDCVGASKGLFFGLLTLVSGLICLILFFVLIDHDNQQVNPEIKIDLSSKSYRAFYGFGQAKFPVVGSVLGSNQFLILS